MGEAVEVTSGIQGLAVQSDEQVEKSCEWHEEELDVDLKWSFALNSVLHRGKSTYNEIAILDTKAFGTILVINGKTEYAEKDEFIYHECLVHPALLCHPNPKSVYIMGGGDGSTIREALRHKNIERVVMCDIDEMVVESCRKFLTANHEAFASPKLCLVINDAKEDLEKREEKFDVIAAELADQIGGGRCYPFYTKSFFEEVIKPRLHRHGIYVTQAGTAGVLSHKEVFTPIYNTLKHAFKYVVAYTAYVTSYADTWGFVMASDEPFSLDGQKVDEMITERIEGKLLYLDGKGLVSSTTMNKIVQKSLMDETNIYT